MSWKILLSLSILAGLAQGANADDTAPDYALHWVVGETDAMAEPAWFKKTKVIVETRLWPTKLYVADAAIQSVDGTALFPKGGQLVQLTSDKFTVCNIPKSEAKQYLSAKKRVCLVDEDGDQRPDTWFSKSSGSYWWFALSGDYPSKREKLGEVSLSEADPQSMKGAPHMSFHFGRFLDKGNFFQSVLDGDRSFSKSVDADSLAQFFFRVGREKRREGMYRLCSDPTPPSVCTSGELPSIFSILGLELEILERRKENALIKVSKGFEGQLIELFDTPDGYTSGEVILVE